MRSFSFVLTFVLTLLLNLGNSSHALNRLPSLIIPDLSEISPFQSEWCAPNSLGEFVNQVCYGHIRFRGSMTVRALEFTLSDGTKAHYMDTDFRGTELLRLDIEIVGPLFNASTSTPNSLLEIGRASLRIDADGEVIAVRSFSNRLGPVLVFKP